MGAYRIAVMEGDGIGPEIVRPTVRVLEAVAGTQTGLSLTFDALPIGLAAHEQVGSTLPASTLEALEAHEAWLLGPLSTHLYRMGDPTMPNVSAHLRKHYELFANVRPARSWPSVPCLYPDVDLVVVRENTEGFYADRNLLDGNGELRPTEDMVISVRVVTRRASERLARVAFDLARRRDKLRKVTLVHKANVLRKGDGLFLDVCREVAAEYPDIAVDDYHVDAMAMHLVMRPQRFDVVLTTNLFGDVLSDEAAGLVGGLGLAPGLNVGAEHVMAQATHGSAPDIAGQGIANPVAEIISGAQLLDHLGRIHADPAALAAADRIAQAVAEVLRTGTRTPDLGGTASPNTFGEAVANTLAGAALAR